MSIGADTVCLECFLRKNVETARGFGDAEKLTLFTKELMGLLAALPADKSTPYIAPQVSDLFNRYYGVGEDRYKAEKEQSNAFAKAWFDQALAMAQQAKDPVLAGLQMAILGNYLDFSALQGKVSFDKLEQMMQNALHTQLDEDKLTVSIDYCPVIAYARTLNQELSPYYIEQTRTLYSAMADSLNMSFNLHYYDDTGKAEFSFKTRKYQGGK